MKTLLISVVAMLSVVSFSAVAEENSEEIYYSSGAGVNAHSAGGNYVIYAGMSNDTYSGQINAKAGTLNYDDDSHMVVSIRRSLADIEEIPLTAIGAKAGFIDAEAFAMVSLINSGYLVETDTYISMTFGALKAETVSGMDMSLLINKEVSDASLFFEMESNPLYAYIKVGVSIDALGGTVGVNYIPGGIERADSQNQADGFGANYSLIF